MMPLGKEVGLGPGHIVRWGLSVRDPAPTAAPRHFRPMLIVTQRSPISATELNKTYMTTQQSVHKQRTINILCAVCELIVV